MVLMYMYICMISHVSKILATFVYRHHLMLLCWLPRMLLSYVRKGVSLLYILNCVLQVEQGTVYMYFVVGVLELCFS